VRVARVAVVFGSFLISTWPSAVLAAPGRCEIVPSLSVCRGSEDDSRKKDSSPGHEADLRMNWGSWDLGSECPDGGAQRPLAIRTLYWVVGSQSGGRVHISDFPGFTNPGSPVPGGPPGAVFGFDGLVHDDTCVSETWAGDVWGRVAELIPQAELSKSPHVRGLTGLETWAWYEGDTQIPPFGFEVTDELTGLSIGVEAWAWITTYRWDFGDGAVGGSVAYRFEDAPSAAGSEGDPPARHTYETSHADAGLAEGYPFGVDVTWVGEFRWWDGAGWSGVEPMVGEAVLSEVIAYPVPEVRSVLRNSAP
jgi:hypothetical protein